MTATKKLLAICSLVTLIGGCASHNSNRVSERLPFDSYLFVKQEMTFRTCKMVDSCDPKCPQQPQAQQQPACPEECAQKEKQCMDARAISTGSGVVIAYDGENSYGITAAHVCLINKPVGTEVLNNKMKVLMLHGSTYEASIDALYVDVDICVLKISKVKLPYVKMSPNPPRRGQKVFNIASPLGIFDSQMAPIFTGFYSGPTSNGKRVNDTYTVPATSGSSGSGVFDSEGRLLGVTSMAIMNFPNFILSSPYAATKSVVDKYQEKVGPALGVEGP
jgi:S1-C subfamily serine protease